jgi:hypothetical protein
VSFLNIDLTPSLTFSVVCLFPPLPNLPRTMSTPLSRLREEEKEGQHSNSQRLNAPAECDGIGQARATPGKKQEMGRMRG